MIVSELIAALLQADPDIEVVLNAALTGRTEPVISLGAHNEMWIANRPTSAPAFVLDAEETP